MERQKILTSFLGKQTSFLEHRKNSSKRLHKTGKPLKWNWQAKTSDKVLRNMKADSEVTIGWRGSGDQYGY